MSILDKKTTVKKPVVEGVYELPLTDVKEVENTEGGFVLLTFANDDIEVTHTIFGSKEKSVNYVIKSLGRQVNKFGKDISLRDVLIKGFVYKIYVNYNEYGRNISFEDYRGQNTNENIEETEAL